MHIPAFKVGLATTLLYNVISVVFHHAWLSDLLVTTTIIITIIDVHACVAVGILL